MHSLPCKGSRNPSTRTLTVVLVATILSGCSLLGEAVYEAPEVSFRSVSIESISLDHIDVQFHFEVDNPNRVGISLEEYTYKLLVNNNDFLSGSHVEPLEISSRSSSTVALPLRLSYRDIYQSVSSVVRADSFAYRLETEVGLNIPVLGKRAIPVQVEGVLPRLRMPQVEFASFNVNSFSFTEVDVTLNLRVSNPNSVGMSLSGLNAVAQLGGTRLSDIRVDDISLASGEDRQVPIRLRMGVAQAGATLLAMLRGESNLQYDIQGEGEVSIDHPAFGDPARLPFHLIGEYLAR